MTDQPEMTEAPRPRVSIDAEAWPHIERVLGDLSYRISAPIVRLIEQTGGVQPVKD